MRLGRLALVLVLVPFLALISCAQQEEDAESQAMEMAMTAVDLEAVGNTIAEMNDAYIEAFVGGDAAALAAMYSADGMRMPPNLTADRGREAIQAAFAKQFEMTASRTLELETIDYGASGELVYSVGTYAVGYEMEGEPVTDSGKWLVVSRVSPEGEWQVVAQVWNSDLPIE
jgi:ketosteroid isomerase-like protein